MEMKKEKNENYIGNGNIKKKSYKVGMIRKFQ
jgi:hypothetical protein